MLIYLLRHGIAEDAGPGMRDEERALTDDGVRRLRRARGAWRKTCEAPDVVLASPLRRAQETAAIFIETFGKTIAVRTEQTLVPDASAQLAMHLLEAELHAGTGCVAVVGHEPHLGHLLGLLLMGNAHHPLPLKKGMLVGVEMESTASSIAALRFAFTQRIAGELA